MPKNQFPLRFSAAGRRKLIVSVLQGCLRQVDADHLRVRDLQRDGPGDAARAGPQVEHARRAVEVHLPQRTDPRGHEQFRLGTGDQYAGPHGEAVLAELREAEHVLDGFAPAEPPQVVQQLRFALRRDGRLRLDDVGVALRAQFLLAEHQNHTPRLRRRVQGLEASDALADEVGEQH